MTSQTPSSAVNTSKIPIPTSKYPHVGKYLPNQKKPPTKSPQVAQPEKKTVDTSTVKGSAALDGDQGILQIFDGSVDSKVCIANTTTLWVSAKLTAPAAVNMYKIASANDHDPRDPKDWTLYGSNDGETWVALDVRSDEDMPERNTYYTYTFNNATEYLYYKLDITSNVGQDAVGLQVVQFSEWQLFVDPSAKVEEEEAKPVKAEVDASTVSGSEDLGGGESKANLFDGKTSTIPSPFMVIATQNPLETKGTFELPEAQLDRFLIKTDMGYPSHSENIEILRRKLNSTSARELATVSADEVLAASRELEDIYVCDDILDYATTVCESTRAGAEILLGASPRALIHLLWVARGYAAIRGRDHVIPDDIKDAAVPVLSHRIVFRNSFGTDKNKAKTFIEKILDSTPVPSEMIEFSRRA